ncbi:DNRLRE domain-containing protein, partial [Brevibacillus sp. HD3.3A]|uniref:DNRLRE domain-containing protein n=1 Tax=Brevibacillus sp. HD3.3A TaxID=2738979 RepID=UPI001E52EBF8
MPVVTLNKASVVTQDTSISQANPTSAYPTGIATRIGVENGIGSAWRSLIKFDLGVIPNDAIINSATLNVVQISAPVGTRTINVHKTTSVWDNTTTWNTQPNFDASVSASITLDNGLVSKAINVKSIVQDWVSGALVNNGFLLKEADEATLSTFRDIGSFDHTTVASQPTLTIDYTIPSSGKKQVEYVGSNTPASGDASTHTPILPSYQSGDLLVVMLGINSSTATITIPSGWTALLNDANNGRKFLIAYRFATNGMANPTFTFSQSLTHGSIVHNFRNVKSIPKNVFSVVSDNTSFNGGGILSDVTSANHLAVVLNVAIRASGSFTPPLSFNEPSDVSVAGNYGFQVAYRYLHEKRGLAPAEKTSTTILPSYGFSGAIILEPLTNNTPTLSLTNPTNNQTLAEGSTFPIAGEASDADNGNVVTVKYKINNGTARAIASGVSDGSSPLSFAKTLTYSNKRL